MSSPTQAAEFRKCPVCSNLTLKKHCESSTCRWEACRNEECKATLDAGKRIGHCKDPLKRKDPKDPRLTRWLRLSYNKVRGWHDRDSD